MFTKGTYKLVDKQGFINANIANLNLANEIESTGGIIIVTRVTDGAAMGVTYGDNTHNEWACIWPNEVRFFERGDGAPVAPALTNPLDLMGAMINRPKDNYPTRDIVIGAGYPRGEIICIKSTDRLPRSNLKLNSHTPTNRQARRLRFAA